MSSMLGNCNTGLTLRSNVPTYRAGTASACAQGTAVISGRLSILFESESLLMRVSSSKPGIATRPSSSIAALKLVLDGGCGWAPHLRSSTWSFSRGARGFIGSFVGATHPTDPRWRSASMRVRSSCTEASNRRWLFTASHTWPGSRPPQRISVPGGSSPRSRTAPVDLCMDRRGRMLCPPRLLLRGGNRRRLCGATHAHPRAHPSDCRHLPIPAYPWGGRFLGRSALVPMLSELAAT
ncbi:hypothetical protein BC628DRAFT_1041687 [Trametes gibbosa]|nr:hypothetical protein BC628DRAFT_1041687 [Trametes gibbosa]